MFNMNILYFLGMKPELVLTADQKVVHFRKHLKKVNKLEKTKGRIVATKNGFRVDKNANNEDTKTNKQPPSIVQNPNLAPSTPLYNIQKIIEHSSRDVRFIVNKSNEVRASSYTLTARNDENIIQNAHNTLSSEELNQPHLDPKQNKETVIYVKPAIKVFQQSTETLHFQNTPIYIPKIIPTNPCQPNNHFSQSVICQEPQSVQKVVLAKVESRRVNGFDNLQRSSKHHQTNVDKDHHEYWNLGHKCRLQQIKHNKRQKLAKINEIIEIFVPSMRTTKIRKEFIVKIINLHKDVSYESVEYGNSDETGLLNYSAKRPRLERKDLRSTLNSFDLLAHFQALDESFVKFAENNQLFKCLLEIDQTELLKKNSQMFVMVSRTNIIANKILFNNV